MATAFWLRDADSVAEQLAEENSPPQETQCVGDRPNEQRWEEASRAVIPLDLVEHSVRCDVLPKLLNLLVRLRLDAEVVRDRRDQGDQLG